MSAPARTALPAILAGFLAVLMLGSTGCRNRDEIDTVAPYIRIVYPPEDTDVLNDIATIRIDVRDNVGVKHVVYMTEGDTLTRLVAEPYTLLWNTTAYPDCTDANSYVLLVALAEDFAGNRRAATRNFYLDNEGLPPIPVDMLPPDNVTKHTARILWERSVEYDFSHYLLRRDTIPDVSGSSDSLVRYDDDPTATSYTDSGKGVSAFGLLEDTDYYYRVWINDDVDSSAASDSAILAHTLLPQPVNLDATALITKYRVGLAWDANDEDVAYYRLHRGAAPLASALDSIAGFPDNVYSYIDSGLTANSTYYYYIYLIDEAGYTHNFFYEGALEVHTLSIPAPVLTDPPAPETKYSATLAWQAVEEQEDSSWLALYRASNTPVDSTDIQVYSGYRENTLAYTDNSLQQARTYYYRMHHRDIQGNTAWSNTVTVTTQSLADIWSGGLGQSGQEKYKVVLTWDPYSYGPEADFAGYILSRDGQIVHSTADASDNSFTNIGLAKNSTYAYRLEVADTSGASVAVTLDASTRDIFPAEIVTLEPTTDWFFRLAWLPSQESDVEFDRYELLRSNDAQETFADDDDDNTADCLSGNCVRVAAFTQRQPADTLTYLDDDPTMAVTIMIDTTLLVPTWVDTALLVDIPVDTTLWVPTLVDTMLLVDTTLVDTALWVDIPVDTTLLVPTWVDTALLIDIPVDTTVADTTLPIYNYVVLTYDVAGEYVRSNIVGDTLYAPPKPVQLSGPDEHLDVYKTTIRLDWTRTAWPPGLEALLFSRYEVWREGSTDQRIAIIKDIDETSYSDADSNLGQQRVWLYVVVVRDIFGQGAPSNEVMGWTKP